MKTKIFLIGLFSVFFSTFSFAATIQGNVSDNSSGSSISGAEVKLYKMGIIIRTEKTDNVGMFEFKDLEEGPYNVRVKAKGYSEYFEKNIIIEKNDFHRMTIFMNVEKLAIVIEHKPLEKLDEVEEMDCATISKDRSFNKRPNGRANYAYNTVGGG